MKKSIVAVVAILLLGSSALAHSGGTDGNGGHYNRSTGEYHYHHGYSAHQHENGVCPYDKKDRTNVTGSVADGAAIVPLSSSDDWYDEYRTEREKRTAVETELNRIKDVQFKNYGIACAGGLCTGMAVLYIQVRRAQRKLLETEARLQLQITDAVSTARKNADNMWQKRLDENAKTWQRKLDDTISQVSEAQAALLRERDEAVRRMQEYQHKLIEAKNPVVRETSAVTTMPESSVSTSQVPIRKPIPVEVDDVKPGEELVYVKRDLSAPYYHREYDKCGVKSLMLARKSSAERFGLKQCPVCNRAAMPTGEHEVYAAPSGSKCYHASNRLFCCGYSAEKVPLSIALQRGLRPCSKCCPPKENPKIWF